MPSPSAGRILSPCACATFVSCLLHMLPACSHPAGLKCLHTQPPNTATPASLGSLERHPSLCLRDLHFTPTAHASLLRSPPAGLKCRHT